MTAETIVRQFNPAALRDLERNHAEVLDPLNVSLAGLVAAERPFWHITSRDDPNFMGLLSRSTQIAIFPQPEDLYVPGSNNLSLAQQKESLAVDEAEVVRNSRKMGIGGLRLVIGDVATHAGLVFAYFDRSGGVRLHGADYGYRYARTETTTVGSFVADVGYFNEFDGLDVLDWLAGNGNPRVWALRLGVPAQE